jgi:hypothetical protein
MIVGSIFLMKGKNVSPISARAEVVTTFKKYGVATLKPEV